MYIQENTFQAILITDGTYTYTIFTYFCGLLEWGTSATVGYNAAENGYENYDPSSLDIACLNIPLSSFWKNVVYRLSTESNEFDLPGNHNSKLIWCCLHKYLPLQSK